MINELRTLDYNLSIKNSIFVLLHYTNSRTTSTNAGSQARVSSRNFTLEGKLMERVAIRPQ